ncbi:uncharacterized protein LOC144624455 [Crassostrea virginica]
MTGVVFVFYCNWAVLLCLSVQAYENLALHKPAWQSNTLLSSFPGVSYTADRAVDGQYTGQCAWSDVSQTAEWRVDLGGIKNIHHVLIHHHDHCPSPGYYGENCSLECPQNCQYGYCDSVEGTCPACRPGFMGLRCMDRHTY